MTIAREDLIPHLKQVSHHRRYVRALCPFHDDQSPSLLVFDDGWRCLAASCNRYGKLDKLMMKVAGTIGSEAEKLNIDWSVAYDVDTFSMISHHNLVNNAFPAYSYLTEKRGLSPDLIDLCEIGWHDGWYTLPIWQMGDLEPTGISFRVGPDLQEKYPFRYAHPPGQPPSIYVPNRERVEKASVIFVTFGMFDAMALEMCLVPAVSSTNGIKLAKTAYLLDQFRKKIVVIPDHGEEAYAGNLAAQLGWRGNWTVLDYTLGAKDPADMLVKDWNSLREQLHKMKRRYE